MPVSGLLLSLALVLFFSVPAMAQDGFVSDGEEDQTTSILEEKPQSLPTTAAPDTLRTNIWLTEALMGEVVKRGTRILPPPPAAVRLYQSSNTDADNLLKEAMVRVLGGEGYSLFLPEDDEARLAAVDYEIDFQVVGIELSYPEVGRTLGIWRQWVSRELTVTAQVEISAADSGRLLFSDRIVRSFADRVSNDDFQHVDSNLYDFTTATTSASGWKGRLEEIVVLGTLAGLIIIYFANTTD